MGESIQKSFEEILSAVQGGRVSALTLAAEGRRYVRRFAPEERLILLGGGHIAVPLCNMAAMLDFSVCVVDDRIAFANSARFPDAAQVLCDSFAEGIEKLSVRDTDYVCVITRGHRWDGECLRQILSGEFPSYLGMIGSRRRVSALLALLREEGYDAGKLAAIHTPIGLKIGAETPAEIAVSICGELVAHRRSRPVDVVAELLERTDTDLSLLRFVAELKEKAVLMTVISTQGSTPVESGAIMAMDEFGTIRGTIGGGCGEAYVMRAARRLRGTGEQRVIEVDMTNDIAAEEGMVCGGKMRVLIEDIS